MKQNCLVFMSEVRRGGSSRCVNLAARKMCAFIRFFVVEKRVFKKFLHNMLDAQNSLFAFHTSTYFQLFGTEFHRFQLRRRAFCCVKTHLLTTSEILSNPECLYLSFLSFFVKFCWRLQNYRVECRRSALVWEKALWWWMNSYMSWISLFSAVR